MTLMIPGTKVTLEGIVVKNTGSKINVATMNGTQVIFEQEGVDNNILSIDGTVEPAVVFPELFDYLKNDNLEGVVIRKNVARDHACVALMTETGKEVWIDKWILNTMTNLGQITRPEESV